MVSSWPLSNANPSSRSMGLDGKLSITNTSIIRSKFLAKENYCGYLPIIVPIETYSQSDTYMLYSDLVSIHRALIPILTAPSKLYFQ